MPRELRHTPISVETLVDLFKHERLKISVKYNSANLWNDDQRAELISSVINGYPIGQIVFRPFLDEADDDVKYEIVDGKNRVAAILDYSKRHRAHMSDVVRYDFYRYMLNISYLYGYEDSLIEIANKLNAN